jgi:hypothetical protein
MTLIVTLRKVLIVVVLMTIGLPQMFFFSSYRKPAFLANLWRDPLII